VNEYRNQLWDALAAGWRDAETDVRALHNERNGEVSIDESDAVFFGRISAEVYPLLAEAEQRGAAELQRRIDVVLAWHNPVESQYRDADGNVTRTVTECIHCSTLTDDGVDWPCATARALGAHAGEVTR
jgi:hypothetical protein